MISGHFSYLEFASSEMAFPFAREVANLARLAVAKARDRSSNKADNGTGPVTTSSRSSTREMELLPLDDVIHALFLPPC
jgi:hypothetical protein